MKSVPIHGNNQSNLFKCNMCDYVGEKGVFMSKHKNTKHQNTNIKESAYMEDNDKIEKSNEYDNNKVKVTENSLVSLCPGLN